MELNIFTDATIKSKSKTDKNLKASFGGYITDKNGKILLNFFSPFEENHVKIKSSNIAIVEAEGIHMGIDYALEMRANKISIYTDNLLCVQMINNYLMNPHPEEYIPSLLNRVAQKDLFEQKTEKIFEKLNRFEEFEIKHLPRLNNQYADYLSEYSFSLFHKGKKSHDSFVKNLSNVLIPEVEYDFIAEKKLGNKNRNHL